MCLMKDTTANKTKAVKRFTQVKEYPTERLSIKEG